MGAGLALAAILAPGLTPIPGAAATPAPPATPNLRCASAMCHSEEAMARLTPDYRRCMAGEAALRREPEALAACAVAEAGRQETARQAAAGRAPRSHDPDVRRIAGEMQALWLAMRQDFCGAVGLDYEGAARTAVEQQCRAYVTAERVLFLEYLLATDSPQ